MNAYILSLSQERLEVSPINKRLTRQKGTMAQLFTS